MAAGAAGSGGRAECLDDRARRHGFRPARVLRRSDCDAEHRRARGGGFALHADAHHGAVLAVTVVRADRTQPPRQRHGGDQRARHRLSGLQRADPVRERVSVRDASAARLQHVLGRQVSPHAVGVRVGGGAVRPVAAGPWLRAVLRIPGWRHQPVGTRARVRQPSGRAASLSRGGLPPDRGPRRHGDLVHRGCQAGRAPQAVLPALLPRCHARAPPRAAGVGGPLQGTVRRRLGGLPRARVRAPEGARDPAGRHRVVAA